MLQRFCCECGKFNCCEFIWYGHCLFHLVWASRGLAWLAGYPVQYESYEAGGSAAPGRVWDAVLASVILDLVLAGSELLHRLRLHRARNKTDAEEEGRGDMEMAEQGQMIHDNSKPTRPLDISYVAK